MSLLLDGPAQAWLHTQTPDIANDFNALCDALKNRFGAQNRAFVFRQELYSRKQRPNEPLSSYTEDIINKCQHLNISDNDMLSIYINGLVDDIKTHVILNQPETFAKAENLARLREAMMSNDSLTNVRTNISQDHRIKELEGQVDLLVSLAANSKPNPNFHASNVNAISPNQALEQGVAIGGQQPVSKSELADFKSDMLAAMDAKFTSLNTQSYRPNRPQRNNRTFARGRNLRMTDGQPVCNNCRRVGHVARYCNFQAFPAPGSDFSQPPPRFSGPRLQFQQLQQQPQYYDSGNSQGNLNRARAFPLESMKAPSIYHGNPNLTNFETDMDLQKWTALRKQTSNISGNNSANVIEEKGPRFSVDRTYSSRDAIEKTSKELPRPIPSISLNDADSQVMQSNVSVWGIVEKQQFKVLVDTGAAVTVVSEKFYQEILHDRHPLITEGGLDSVRTANGNTVPVRGTVTFSIVLGNNAYVCSASVVVGLLYNIVLGKDFLHDFSAIIDVRGQVVTFVGGNRVTFALENDPPIVSNVKVAKTIVIDAQSESPFHLLYGQEPQLPTDASLLLPSSSHLSSSVAEHRAGIFQSLERAIRLISANTQLAQQRMKEQYDRTSKPVPFDIGCKVWVYTPKWKKGLSKKLMHNNHGPYRIVARLSPVHFRLRTMENRPVAVPVHANRMKPYFDPNDRPN